MAEGNAITVKIGAETDGIERGLNEIQNSLKKIEKSGGDSGESFNGSFGKMAAAVAVGQAAVNVFGSVVNGVFSSAQKVVDGFSAALDLGGTLSDLSASTGETAGNLLLLQRAFDNTGAGADKVGPAMAKLQNNIFGAGEDSKAAAAAFGRMGLSLEELAGKTPTEQLALVASGITSIEDPTKRAATAIDIFGKSGAELLPLLTNFSGEMDEARATVGSLAEIMDRRANVFDAVGDRFLIIQQKVRDFAAGILDRALPAIDAITSALSRIDAAAIGQNLANAFIGGQQAMKGFQAAVDAISIGKVGLAFEVFWESLKLQAMQTADAVYKNLVAGFQTASDFISQIFRADGPALTLIKTSFGLVGSYISEKLYTALADFMESIGRMGMAEKFRYQAETSAIEVQRALDTIPVYAGIVAQDAGDALANTPEQFKANLAEIPPLFDGITAQQAKVAALEGQVTAQAAATTAEREKQAEQTDAELARRQAVKDAAEAAAASERAAKTELVSLETSLNEAKAAGNTHLAASLEKELASLKAKEEIAKLTEEYVKTLGVDANEAARLATNFVNAKNAANSIGDRAVSVSVTTKVDDTRWKDLLADIAANADPKTVQVAMAVTGKDTLSEAYSTLQDMEQINKNYQAAFSAIGAQSIEEVKANLDGIPTEAQRQLALQITGEEDFDRAVQKLDSFSGTKSANLLLQTQGFESMDAFQNQLNGIVGEKRTNLILEALGVDTAKEASDALARILANDGKTASVQIAADTTEAQTQIAALSATTQSLNLDASASIEQIKTSLAQEIDLALNSSKGSGFLEEIKGFVSDIKDLVGKIEPKLPVAALTA